MNSEVTQMHMKSGLIEQVKRSNVTVEYAEAETLKFFKEHCDANTALLSGNSVWQDRNFLQKYMPSLVDFCYYRLLDITAIKEVIRRWYSGDPNAEFKKKENHRAMDDIFDSIEELRHYRKYFFVQKN
jgi:oligoribonuclease